MRTLKLSLFSLFVLGLIFSVGIKPTAVHSQIGINPVDEFPDAPAGFDNQTNEFEKQGEPDVPGTFLGDKTIFEKRDTVETGLGPVYNAQSCTECHQNPVTGGISQVVELRAGHSGPNGEFVDEPGGSLNQARAINAQIQERVPDGSRIAFTSNNLITVMGFDGGQYGPVGNTPVTGLAPTFSPDGKQLAFQRNVGGSNYNIFVMNNDGTNLHQITTTVGQDTVPAWSPDGTKIAFASRRTGHWQIFLMNPDGSNQVNISNTTAIGADDIHPAWSPNGTKIAFARTPSAINPLEKIWTMNADGSLQTQITLGLGNDERPTYSPDGTTIAFSTTRDGNSEIYKVPASGGVETRLTNNLAADQFPAWSPDGNVIAFTSDRDGIGSHIWGIAPDGTQTTLISQLPGLVPTYSRDQGENIRTFRTSLNTLGDGFVEAIDDSTLLAIRDNQPAAMQGTAIYVPSLEAPNEQRVGRFGWKDSIASLLTFSATAYQAEVGITSPLKLAESTSLGRSVTEFDTVADPEDDGGEQGFGEDVEAFTRFMRATMAPPRDRTLVPDDATDPGSLLFDQIQCSVCHIRDIHTASPHAVFNNGTFFVGDALGNKTIHPFGDFLLHDIGTGDGIVETNGELTRNKVRTAPLWGVRTRERLMHDGGGSSSAPTNNGAQAFTFNEAILRHTGQANASKNAFQALTPIQRMQVIRFLKSL
jgi:Tol biopolymer transport system component